MLPQSFWKLYEPCSVGIFITVQNWNYAYLPTRVSASLRKEEIGAMKLQKRNEAAEEEEKR